MESNRDNTYRGRNRPPGGGASSGSPIDDARDTIRDTADNVGATIGSIIEDLQGIVRGEVQLAKTELKEEAGQMGRGAGMIGAGVFFGLVGFIFLMLAITYLLAEWMDMWIAAGIVAVVLIIVAAILAMSGKNQISDANLTPDQTIDSLKEDKEWASRQMNSVKK